MTKHGLRLTLSLSLHLLILVVSSNSGVVTVTFKAHVGFRLLLIEFLTFE